MRIYPIVFLPLAFCGSSEMAFAKMHDNLNSNLLQLKSNQNSLNMKPALQPVLKQNPYHRDPRDIPIDVYYMISKYLDYPSFLHFISACKMFRLAGEQRVSDDLTGFGGRSFTFDDDQLNRVMHAFLHKNSFFTLAPESRPIDYIPMMLRDHLRHINAFKNIPGPLYRHMMLYVTAAFLRDLDTFELVRTVFGYLEIVYSENKDHKFERVYVIKALVMHKRTVLDTFFSSEFLSGPPTLPHFNALLHSNLPEAEAAALLKSLYPASYNQTLDKSYSAVMQGYTCGLAFIPFFDSFPETLMTAFEREKQRNPDSLIFKLLSKLVYAEEAPWIAFLFIAYVRFFSQQLVSATFDLCMWWSLFYSLCFDFIHEYPQYADSIFTLAEVENEQELEKLFVSIIPGSKVALLETAASHGHCTALSFLLHRFPFSQFDLQTALVNSCKTEHLSTIEILLGRIENLPLDILKRSLKTCVDVNSVAVFKHLLELYSRILPQEFINSLLIESVTGFFLELILHLLNRFTFPPSVFVRCLEIASKIPESELFTYLLTQQPYYKYSQQEVDNLLVIYSVEPGDVDSLVDLCESPIIEFSDRGVVNALSNALNHHNHPAIACIIGFWEIGPNISDSLLLHAASLGHLPTTQFLFTVGLDFSRNGLFNAHNAAVKINDYQTFAYLASKIISIDK